MKDSTNAMNTVNPTSPGSGGTTTLVAGGGIFGTTNPTTITESTIVGNALSGSGGTFTSTGGGIFGDSHTTIKDSIVALNKAATGPDCYQMITSGGHNLIGKTAGCSYTSGSGDKL